jgi:tRNA nucleotidyltransferase (CCA-adding enzyme)
MTALIERGHSVYAVGGCVRDSLLGRDPADRDLASSALPEEIFNALGGEITGGKYGTVTVQGIEITPFRREGKYTDHRRPDFIEFVTDLKTDLSRRDFTVNAMAVGIDGRVTDIFNGLGDLERKLIRTVGDPKLRFEEDALRILRALRFAAVLDFEIEEETFLALSEYAHTLRFLTKTVIRREMDKLRAGIAAERILSKMEHLRKYYD